MTSLVNSIGPQIAAIKQDDANDGFHCQFCPMRFGTQSEYKTHTFGHFNTLICADCNVHLIKICDEWYEVHTVANCQNNNHIHTFNTNNTNHDSGEIVAIKQEPQVELGPTQLDELLNVKTDVDVEDFGEVFATTLNTIESNENSGIDSILPQRSNHSNVLTEFDISKTQCNYQVVNITEKCNAEKKRTKGFECEFCSRVFKTRVEHCSHILNYHTNNETCCKYCFRNFESSQQLNNHIIRCKFYIKKRKRTRAHPHRPKENFACDICSATLKKFSSLEGHMQEVHSSKFTFKCHVCKISYPNRYYLSKHMLRHKLGLYNGQAMEGALKDDFDEVLMVNAKIVRTQPNERKTEFHCDQCGKVYKKFYLLTYHKRLKHQFGYQCRKCNRSYANRAALTEHMKNHDQNQNQKEKEDNTQSTEQEFNVVIETKKKDVKSKEKGKLNTKKDENDLDNDSIERKYTRVHPHRPTSNFTCDICQKVLTTFNSIREHMRCKHIRKIFAKYHCSKCAKDFDTKTYLERHRKRQHPKIDGVELDKPVNTHMCSTCGRLYSNSSELRKHEIIHQGIRFPCHLCDKSFTYSSSLKKHIKGIHEGIKSLVCDIDGCTWRFYLLQSFKRHQARIHGLVNNRNPCPICGKEFPDSKYHLQRHLKYHANNTAREYIPGTKRAYRVKKQT